MTIKQANSLNKITDAVLTAIFGPFIILFVGFGYITRFYRYLKFNIGRKFLLKVDNITYDTEDQKEEITGQYTAKEIYVLIKEHLSEKEKAYKETLKSVDEILNETNNKK